MEWIAGYALASIGLCLLTVAAHDIGEWARKRGLITYVVTIEKIIGE